MLQQGGMSRLQHHYLGLYCLAKHRLADLERPGKPWWLSGWLPWLNGHKPPWARHCRPLDTYSRTSEMIAIVIHSKFFRTIWGWRRPLIFTSWWFWVEIRVGSSHTGLQKKTHGLSWKVSICRKNWHFYPRLSDSSLPALLPQFFCFFSHYKVFSFFHRYETNTLTNHLPSTHTCALDSTLACLSLSLSLKLTTCLCPYLSWPTPKINF